MKKSLTIARILLAAVFMAAGLTGCRVNNGDIGLLYGTWAVTDVEVDGLPYEGWHTDGYDDTFFQFQNNICFVTRTNERYDAESRTATWEWVKGDTEITLDFTHHDTQFPTPVPGGYMYGAPEWLLLTQPGVYTFSVEWTDDRHTVWTTVNTEGQRITYRMKQTW